MVTCQVCQLVSGLLPRDVDTQPLHAAVPKVRDGGPHLQGYRPAIGQGSNDFASRDDVLFFGRMPTACFGLENAAVFIVSTASLSVDWELLRKMQVVGNESPKLQFSPSLVDTTRT